MSNEAQAADFVIEFLEEDADIVQQCVQNVEPIPELVDTRKNNIETALLVERVPSEKPTRKRKKKEEDSDYDPTDDIPQRGRKKRQQNYSRSTSTRGRRFEFVPKSDIKQRKPKTAVEKFEYINRRKLCIKIPNYDDPLCLPVRATLKDEWDTEKLKKWNNLCLEHFKNYDNPLRAETEESVSSRRTIVLRNIKNKITGKIETTMYTKTCVENKNEQKNSEVVQAVLPKYRENKVLNTYRLSESKKSRTFHYKDEVLLTKEVNKDVESLVVYKPREKLSLVYKMFEKEGDDVDKDDSDRLYLKEVASCKTCAMCYQTSWRGFKKNYTKNIRCQVCIRPCISVYNLLGHLKSHPDTQVRAAKRAIARSLASVMEYHYKCRICQQQFLSIKELRKHVKTHNGIDSFKCEVGNHITT